MGDEAALVRPASSVPKPKGVDKRRSVESLRSSTSGVKGVQGSTGSSHELCKKNIVEKNVVAKPKPSSDRKIESPAREKGKQGIVATSEHVDVRTEESSLDVMVTVTGESKIYEGAESSVPSEEVVEQDIPVASEIGEVTAQETLSSPSTKDLDLFKKSCTISKGKPSLLRLPSLISSGSSVGETIDGRMDGKKVLRGSKSFDGTKVVQVRKSLDVRNRSDGSKTVNPEIAKKDDGNGSNVENPNEGSKSVGEMKSLEGSKRSPAKKRLQKSKSLNLETNIKDGGLVNGKNIGKSETLKKHVAAPKPKILSMKPSRSLNPVAVNPSSLFYRSRVSSSKKSDGDDDKVVKKISTSKLNAKKISKPTSLSPSSSSPSVNGEEGTDTKKVRIVTILPSARRQSKLTKVVAMDLNDQGVKEDTVDVIEQVPAEKSQASTKNKMTSSNSVPSPAPLVSKSGLRSRISSLPSRSKKSLGESEQKIAAKDASLSGLQKSKAIDLESENLRPSKLKVRTTTMVAETIPRRSYLKKDSPAGNVHKNSTDKFLPGHPSFRRKKTVQVLSNKVIEETANRLIRTRKSKVLALIGAFETVISIQKKSSARTTSKGKKRISSSKPSR